MSGLSYIVFSVLNELTIILPVKKGLERDYWAKGYITLSYVKDDVKIRCFIKFIINIYQQIKKCKSVNIC